MQQSGVHPSVPSTNRPQQWRVAGLLLGVPQAGDIIRQWPAATAPQQQMRAVSRLQPP